MLLRMPSPVRLNSAVHYLRKRVPSEVLAAAVNTTLRIPVGEVVVPVRIGRGGTVKVSLRTTDPKVAKERQAVALSYLDKFWSSLRDGPRRLDHQDVIALAGVWYRRTKAIWERDPGRATMWTILSNSAEKWDDDAAQREMRPYVAELLEEEGLKLDQDTQVRLAKAMHRAFKEVTGLLERRVRHDDYGKDEAEGRFPEWKPEASSSEPPTKVAVMVLFADWERETRLANRTESTINGYRSLMQRFVDFVGHDDALRLTPEDVIRWKDDRLNAGVSLKTVKHSDLATLRSVFGWAAENRRIPESPVPKLRLKLGKKNHEREKGFTYSEGVSLLRSARDYVAAPRELDKTAAAKRWVPWLCAYTGSRVGEMVQLRRGDVEQHGSYLIVTITPEAGKVKDKTTRRVVLHSHLVDLGFADFVNGSADGYLFVNAKNRAEADGRVRAVKNRLCEFVRKTAKDKRVSPNHGWRHRFQTIGREVDAREGIVNAICGHGRRDVADDYGDATFKAMATALAKYPRYEIDQPAEPSESEQAA
jgi:integrase